MPKFPVCSNPQGELKVEYPSGTHGIPGDSNAYTGTDKVYNLSADRLIQCFCPENGNGIQTNWLRINEISDDDLNYYKNLGWIYIPDGSVWGLENGPYLAYNTSYSCGNGGIGGPEPGDIGPAGISTTNVLSLAGTGDSARLFSLGIAGLLFMLLGVNTRSHETK
ncbi:hypothetical protein HYT02_03060 [Candidatus Gottesmanbacteria bacterium]|nr:hypothetical protein [Candidatus Gottesmanbacteria bacterium]